MPKSTTSKLKIRPHPLDSASKSSKAQSKSKSKTKSPNNGGSAGQGRGKRPQVSVTYEGKPVNGKGKGKGKGKAKAVARDEDDDTEEEEEEDEKPDISLDLHDGLDEDENSDEDQDIDVEGATASGSTSSISSSKASFILVAGSYEKNLYGIEGTFSPSSTPSTSTSTSSSATPATTSANLDLTLNLTLKPAFIFPAHLSCIKSLSVSSNGKHLVTGGDDEFIKVWDLRGRREVGRLGGHVGTITSLTFPSSSSTPSSTSHLLSTSEDSTITIFRTRDWVPLRTLKGHVGRVNGVDVHPSGRVALSVGRDGTLRMWDLMRGRGASSLGLGYEGLKVKFAKSGKIFAVLGPSGIDVYSIGMKKLQTLLHPQKKRINDFIFLNLVNPTDSTTSDSTSELEKEEETFIFAGTEDGKVLVWSVDEDFADDEDVEEGEEGCLLVGKFGGHTNRVKSLDSLMAPRPAPYPPLPIISTVSSDGKMNIYNALDVFSPSTADPSSTTAASEDKEEEEYQTIASWDSQGSRLVCCAVGVVGVKGGRQQQEKKEAVGKGKEKGKGKGDEKPVVKAGGEEAEAVRFDDGEGSGSEEGDVAAGEEDEGDEEEELEEEEEEEEEEEHEMEEE